MHIIFTLNANDFIEMFICFITSASHDLILRIKKPKKYGYNVFIIFYYVSTVGKTAVKLSIKK